MHERISPKGLCENFYSVGDKIVALNNIEFSLLTAFYRCFARSASSPAHRREWLQRAGRVLFLLSLSAVIGCTGLTPAYKGTPARPDNRLALAAIEGASQVWQTRDLALHFTAVVEKEALVTDGRVERLGPIEHFAWIDAFRVSIHFIDAEGGILDSRLLWTAGVGGDAYLVRWTFSRRYDLPAQTSAIGFSYRGAFSENGEDGGRTSWEVWQEP